MTIASVSENEDFYWEGGIPAFLKRLVKKVSGLYIFFFHNYIHMCPRYLQEEMSRDTIVELLLNHGAKVNVVSDSGRTALSYACEQRCNDIVDILVKHASVDPDIPDIDGM